MEKLHGPDHKKVLFDTFIALSSAAILQHLTVHSFTQGIRRQVLESAGGRCGDCGTSSDRLIASHTFHGRGRKLNKLENGSARCPICETIYHLRHVNRASKIGLSEDGNDWAIRMNIAGLTDDQIRLVQQNRPHEYRIWKQRLRR